MECRQTGANSGEAGEPADEQSDEEDDHGAAQYLDHSAARRFEIVFA